MGDNLLINGVYVGYNPLILTFDPNFQRDIQVRFSSLQNSFPQGTRGCTPNVRVPMVFIVFNLGIVGDEKTYNYLRYYIVFVFSGFPSGVRWYIQLSSDFHFNFAEDFMGGTFPTG